MAETDVPTWFAWTAGGITVFLCILGLIWLAGFLMREHYSADGHVLRAMVQAIALCAVIVMACVLLTAVLVGSASALENPVYTVASLIVVMALAMLTAPASVTGVVALGVTLGYLLTRPLILLIETWPRKGGSV